MTIDEQTVEAKAAMLALERVTLDTFAKARALITAQEEEIRRLRVEKARRNDEALTEHQVAEILQVGFQTIGNLRRAGVIKPSFYLVSLPRYWRSELPEIFANQKTPRRKQRLELVKEEKAS